MSSEIVKELDDYRETMYNGWVRGKYVTGSQDLEKELEALEENKLTLEFLNNQIVETTFTKIGDRLTHCLIIVKNGYIFTGESSCVDAANYNKSMGEKIAYDNAFDKMWPVYGFILRQHLAETNRL